MFGGFIIAKSKHDPVAGYIWISGCIFFALVCVWVIDLPTGPGLCEKCGAIEKLYRTFFDVTHGSGLMGGDGLLVGSWIPLSMIGYAIGARFALEPTDSVATNGSTSAKPQNKSRSDRRPRRAHLRLYGLSLSMKCL